MVTKLESLTLRAREDPKCRFTSLAHLLSEDFLKECFRELKRDKASGIDGVTVQGYEVNLEENLKDLVGRMKAKRYRPQPVRRAYIPKPDGGKRGLGIPAVEDKIVQMGIKKILEAIFEVDFMDVSYGFRPNRSCHDALDVLDKAMMTKPVNYVVDMDIEKFLETSSYCTPSHERLSKRAGWVTNTLIYKPFRFPQRTWTAESSPRFTRCNTVWRETPRSLVASSIGTWFSGTS